MKKTITLLFFTISSIAHSVAATFTVTNTNDTGAGSLRQAIINANAATDADVINFNIPGTGPFTIAPLSVLPSITNPVVINALTQPGASVGNPAIVLNGASAGTTADGLLVFATNSTIQGLVINGFSRYGIFLIGGSNSVISNYIGTDISGTTAVANGV